MEKKIYKPKEDHPEELEISTYFSNGSGRSLLREGLPFDHQENLYNWFCRTYPDLNPSFYGIEHPLEKLYKGKTREELIREIILLKSLTFC